MCPVCILFRRVACASDSASSTWSADKMQTVGAAVYLIQSVALPDSLSLLRPVAVRRLVIKLTNECPLRRDPRRKGLSFSTSTTPRAIPNGAPPRLPCPTHGDPRHLQGMVPSRKGVGYRRDSDWGIGIRLKSGRIQIGPDIRRTRGSAPTHYRGSGSGIWWITARVGCGTSR